MPQGAPSIKPEFEQTDFSLECLFPFKAKSFNRWMLSSYEEVWEGERRRRSSRYFNQLEPVKKQKKQKNLTSKSASKVCEKKDSVKLGGHYCPGVFPFFLSESKKILVDLYQECIV